jgi:hypothetical protein
MIVVYRARRQNMETYKVEHLCIATTLKAAIQFCEKEVAAQWGDFATEWEFVDSTFAQREAFCLRVRYAYNIERETVLTKKDTEALTF